MNEQEAVEKILIFLSHGNWPEAEKVLDQLADQTLRRAVLRRLSGMEHNLNAFVYDMKANR